MKRFTSFLPRTLQNRSFSPFSLLTRQPGRRVLLTESIANDIKTYGAKYYYYSIFDQGQYKYIPLYVHSLLHKFAYVGVNRNINYKLYMRYLEICYSKKRRLGTVQGEPKVEEKEAQTQEVPKDAKKIEFTINLVTLRNFAIFWAISSLLTYFIFSQLRRDTSNEFLDPTNSASVRIDEVTLMNKLLQNLKEICIKQIARDYPEYSIIMRYQDDTEEVFRYNGNINDFLSMIEHYEQGRFDKTKIYFDHQTYSFWSSFGDGLRLLSPFIGIAITFFIFKKFSPDSILSKISNKKSFKIQGLRDIKVKFNDVAGMEQAKKEITQFVDFLKFGEKYKEMGAKIPKGALLTGPPGTGKTMLAKACAGQAGVTFFYISGSEFVQMFVGLGASKVRELFSRARMEAPSIIFIDQIDAIGKKRQTSRNQEKDSTLNQLLVQMDGFSSHQTVIVLAATNRKDILDSALTRPGRFDRMVQVTLPDIKAREEIYKVHLKPLKIDPNRKLQDLAKRLSELSPGFSGADIANLCNEAAIIATRGQKNYIEEKDFEDASQRITAGYEKKNLMNPKTKQRVAYHEAGHAVSGWFLKGGDPLVKLTIIPRSKGALGYAQYLPKSSYIRTKADLIDQVAIMLGGLTSEQILLGSASSGASDDLQKVYQVTRKMVAQYGMGKDIYNITVDDESYVRKQSQFLIQKVDEEMMLLVEQARKKSRQVLLEHKEGLQNLAKLLLQKQTINGEDIRCILGERPKFT